MTLPARSWFLILTPLLLAAMLTLHPMPEGDVVYDGIRDHVTPWLIVHIALLPGACLMGVVLYQLLRGLTGRAATVSRIALVPFALCFVAWEGTIGIGTGLLVDDANGLPAGPERDAASADVQEHYTNPVIGDPSVIGMIANAAWIVAVIAAGIALRRPGAGTAATILLCLASLFTFHAIIVGSIGLACLAAAAVLVERKRVRAPGHGGLGRRSQPDARQSVARKPGPMSATRTPLTVVVPRGGRRQCSRRARRSARSVARATSTRELTPSL